MLATHAPPSPISPAAKLYLTPLAHGNDARFARLCAETWSRIPQAYRWPLTRHWSRHPPRVELLYGWTQAGKVLEPPNGDRPLPLAEPSGHQGRMLACCADYGMTLWFPGGIL
jgi:hypothetical protein